MNEEIEALIQRIIRKESNGYAIIAVIHRENTVQDFDWMVVMESVLLLVLVECHVRGKLR